MKIIFMGTPDFAVNTLRAIIQAGHEVACVVTQPDKPRGRGKEMQFPSVKEYAVSQDLPVFQPIKIREAECVERLRTYEAELIVVVAFGQILPQVILDMPKYGCINVHASLLPKYRGAAPIQWAVINGEKTSGVTIMQMDSGLDTGDMIAKTEVALTPQETGGSLHDKLAQAGAVLCVETIEKIGNQTAVKEKQDDSLSCYAKMLHKQMGNIDWTQDAEVIEKLIRGLNPWPSAYTHVNGKTIKIWKAAVREDMPDVKPGQAVRKDGAELLVQTGKGSLSLQEVQLEGKKRMLIDEFLRGRSIESGTMLTKEK